MQNLKYLIALSSFLKFGARNLNKISDYFSDYEKAFFASKTELVQAGVKESTADEFIVFRKNLEPDKIMEQMEKEKIDALTINDFKYPKLLKEIYNPPFLIFYKGDINLNSDFLISIVGTRRPSSYGERAVTEIVSGLAQKGITTVSGLAIGIDSLAHTASLNANSKTIAILANGLDNKNIHPSCNKNLAEKIIINGALISEFPPNTPALKHHFPMRNRIIAGLSPGTIVIEAGKRSGALITAFLALEQNREVLAVPGSIFSETSRGTNMLISKGAKLINSAEDVLNHFNLPKLENLNEKKATIPTTKEEDEIVFLLSFEPMHIDDITRLSKRPAPTVAGLLVMLEIKGLVENQGNMFFIKKIPA